MQPGRELSGGGRRQQGNSEAHRSVIHKPLDIVVRGRAFCATEGEGIDHDEAVLPLPQNQVQKGFGDKVVFHAGDKWMNSNIHHSKVLTMNGGAIRSRLGEGPLVARRAPRDVHGGRGPLSLR